jgi:hypothetical protein
MQGEGKNKCFRVDPEGVLWFNERIVVPKDHKLRKQIMDEVHLSKFSIHPGSTKMYQDLKQNFLWTRMRREIAKYVSECDICQIVKASHLKTAGILQPLPIPSWKWEDISMDFIVGLPNTSLNQDCTFPSRAYYVYCQKVCRDLFRSNCSSSWNTYDDHF